MVVRNEKTERKKMKNEVTAYGILKALKECGEPCSAALIAQMANIDTTSENLQKISDELYDFADLGFVKICPTSTQNQRSRPWFQVAS